MTRLQSTVLIAGLLAFAGAAGVQAGTPGQQTDTARQLLQRAVHLEEAVGDPEAAIATYESVLAAPDADAPLAAVAEFRMAVLLSRIGRVAEARDHHRRIAARYASDSRLVELVQMARAALGEDSGRINSDAMVARRLWAGNEAYAYGALSPDGSFISFVDWASGNLAVHDLDRGSPRFVTDLSEALANDAWCSSVVSPDGNRIAYTWYSAESGFEVRTVGRDGDDESVVLTGWDRPRHVELESWSADGKKLLALVYVDESTHDLAMIDAASGSIRTIASLGATAPELARLSPDGRWIAYHRVDEQGTHDILLTAADGSITLKLLDHPANDLLPIWTTDGRHVLFVSDRTGTLGAWVVEVGSDGIRLGEPRLIKSDFGRSIPMGFTEHGALIYAQQVSLNDIYTATLDSESGALGERLATGSRFVGVNRSPAMSPDGARMAYLSERGMLPAGLGTPQLVVRDVETRMEHVVSPKLRKILEPRWHPDGQRLIAEALDKENHWGIFTIDANSGAIEALVEWDASTCGCTAAPATSHDGKQLAYYRPGNDDASGALVVRHLATGAERVLVDGLAPRDVLSLAFDPSGKTLAAATRRRESDRSQSWMLEYITVYDGTRRDIAPMGSDAEAIDIIGWSAEWRGVLFVRAGTDRHSLEWTSDDGDTARTLVAELPLDVRDVRLHPRYDRVVFTAGEYRAEIWMLENPLASVNGSRRRSE